MEREGSTQKSTGGAPPYALISSYVTTPMWLHLRVSLTWYIIWGMRFLIHELWGDM